MANVRVTRRLHFSAAHRLHREDWSDERNEAVFGLCSNPNWHGHNYELDVTLEGPIDPETGFVYDLKQLRELVEERVVLDVDHRNLNLDVAWMSGVIPTTENLVVAIWDRIAHALPGGVRLARLVLYETPRNFVEYEGR
ncbi:MAG TPA: 6-carboxytetrahydropterin synthase [Longimicrobiales bacterium]